MRTARIILTFVLAAAAAGLASGCFTIGLEATDIASKKAAEQPGALGAVGQGAQKGVQEVKKVEHKAVEAVKKAVE